MKNYSDEQITNMFGQLAEVNLHQDAQISKLSDVIYTLSSQVKETSDDVRSVRSEMNQLRTDLIDNSEISTEQCKEMKAAVSRRVYKIMEYHGITDHAEQKKYSHALHSRCWAECRRHSGIASSYQRTKRRDYDQAMEVIEAWVPSKGFSSIKTRCDEAIAAKRRQDVENIAQGLQMFSQKYAKNPTV